MTEVIFADRNTSDVATLNAVTDELNAALDTAESAIRSFKFNTPARVPLPGDDGALGWGRVAGDWSFIYVRPHGEEIPLDEASRAVRIAATHVLPELVDALRQAVADQIAESRRAVTRTREFIDMLQPKVDS